MVYMYNSIYTEGCRGQDLFGGLDKNFDANFATKKEKDVRCVCIVCSIAISRFWLVFD